MSDSDKELGYVDSSGSDEGEHIAVKSSKKTNFSVLKANEKEKDEITGEQRNTIIREMKALNSKLDLSDPEQSSEYSTKGFIGTYARCITFCWFLFIPLLLAMFAAPIIGVFVAVDNPVQIDTGHSSFAVDGHDATDSFLAYTAAKEGDAYANSEVQQLVAEQAAAWEAAQGTGRFLKVGEGTIGDINDLKMQVWLEKQQRKRLLSEENLIGPRRLQDQQTYSQWTLITLYEWIDTRDSGADGNLLTELMLSKIKVVETMIESFQGNIGHYRDFCRRIDGECDRPNSCINFFFPSSNNGNLVPDGLGSDIANVTDTSRTLATQDLTGFFASTFSKLNLASPIIKSSFNFGIPQAGFTSINDRYSTQESNFHTFMEEMLPFFQDISANFQTTAAALNLPTLPESEWHMDDLRVMYGEAHLTEFEFFEVLGNDLLYALGSLCVVFTYMWFHTTSLFLAIVGIGGILLSFSPTFAIYRVVYDQAWMGVMNLLGIFIILGIGTDDVFVFTDLFAQCHDEDSKGNEVPLNAKIASTLRRAGAAMFVTTVTTAAAFFANYVSAVPPIRDFGIFMGLLVIFNYLEVMTLYPCFLIMWTKTFGALFAKISLAISKNSKKKLEKESHRARAEAGVDDSDYSSVDSSDEHREREGLWQKAGAHAMATAGDKVKPSIGVVGLEMAAEAKIDFVRKKRAPKPSFWMDNQVGAATKFWAKFHHFIHKFRFALMIFYTIIFCIGVWKASQLQPAEEPPQFLPDDHNIQRLEDFKKELSAGSTYSSLSVSELTVTVCEGGCAVYNSDGSITFTDESSTGTTAVATTTDSATVAAVKTDPSPVYSVTAEATGTSSVLVSWTAPSKVSLPVTGIDVQRSTATTNSCSSSWISNEVTDTSATSIELGNLPFGTKFCFRVAYENLNGWGDPGTPAIATTQTLKPGAPVIPENAVSDVSSSGMTISWTPNEYEGNSAVDQFRVEISTGTRRMLESDTGRRVQTTWTVIYEGSGCTSSLVVSTGSCTSTCCAQTDICGGVTPLFRVSAHNDEGWSSPSTSIVGGELPSGTPSAPGIITFPDVTQNSLTAQWTPPACDNGSPITGYRVFVNDVSQGETTELTYDITGLSGGTTYTVSVIALADGSFSDASIITETTLPSTPGQPTNLQATTGATSTTVTWEGDTGGSDILQLRLTINDQDTEVDYEGSHSITFDTEVGSDYTFSLAMQNVNGYGPESDQLSFSTPNVAPNPPVISVDTIQISSVNLEWTAPADGGAAITSYTFERSGPHGSDTADPSWVVATPSLDRTASVDTAEEQFYFFRVKATNSIGSSDYSNVLSYEAVSAKPGVPTGVSISAIGFTEMTVSWSPPSYLGNAGDVSYEVTRTGGSGAAVPYTGSDVSFTDTGLESGVEYSYTVVAENTAGQSAASEAATGTTDSGNPDAPTGVSISGRTDVEFTVSWDAPENVGDGLDNYLLEFKPASDEDWQTFSTPTATTDTITGLTIDTSYDVRVSACGNSCGESAEKSTSTRSADPSSPSKPGITEDGTTLTVTWSDPSYVGPDGSSITDCLLERKLGSGGEWGTAYEGGDKTYEDTGLNLGSTYFYRVSCKNDNSDTYSATSSEASQKTGTTVPSVVPSLTLEVGSDGLSIDATWEEPTDTGGAAIELYEVRIWLSTDDEPTTEDSYGLALTASLSGLTAGETYNVRVRASNANGFVDNGQDGFTNTKSKAIPAQAPTSPTPTDTDNWSRGADSMELRFTAPTSDGGSAITEYRYGAYVSGNDPPGTFTTIALGDVTDTDGTLSYTTGAVLTPNTEYGFRLKACNVDGCSTQSAEVLKFTQTEQPSAPGTPTYPDLDQNLSTELKVSWTAPDWIPNGGTPPYQLEYSLDEAAWTQAPDVDTETTVTVTGLTSDTSYFFRVRACNTLVDEDTCGEYSTTSSETTSKAAAGPPIIAASGYGPGIEISLTWTTPAQPGENPTNTYEYALKATNTAEFGATATALGADVLTVTAATTTDDVPAALTAGESYDIRVRMTEGASPAGDWSETTTIALPAVPDKPGTPEASGASSQSSFTVTWTVPAYIGPDDINKYRIQYREAGLDSFFLVDVTEGVDNNYNSYTHDFGNTNNAGKDYEVKVQAHTATGNSENSDLGTITIGTSVPDPVANLAESSKTSSTIKVSWEEPAETGGRAIDAYKVEYRPDGGDYTTDSETLTSLSRTISGLDAFTEYDIRVSAHNEVGWSSTQTITITTEAGAPAAPADPFSLRRRLSEGDAPTTRRRLASSTTFTTITVDINKVDDGSVAAGGLAVTGYRLEVRESGGSWPSGTDAADAAPAPIRQVIDPFDPATQEVTVSSLTPGTDYDLRLRICNSDGCGDASASVSLSTPASLPSKPSISKPFDDVQKTEFTFSWNAPDFTCADNADLLNANIQACEADFYMLEKQQVCDSCADTWEVHSDTIPFADSSITVDGLTAGTTMNFRLSAHNTCTCSDGQECDAANICGWGAVSSTKSEITTTSEPTTVRSLTLGIVNTESAVVDWVSPSDTGGAAITAYKVEYKLEADADFTEVQVATTSYTITGVQPAQTYNVQITASNSVGDSPVAELDAFRIPDCTSEEVGGETVYCSGNGECRLDGLNDVCSCFDGDGAVGSTSVFAGADCQFDCPGVVGENPCNNVGTCTSDGSKAVCTCDDPDSYVGDACEPCPGVPELAACNGRGTCSWDGSAAVCECNSDYTFTDCSLACPGLGEPEGVCSGHGDCRAESEFVAVCDCNSDFGGTYCNVTAPEPIAEVGYDLVAHNMVTIFWDAPFADSSAPVDTYRIEYRLRNTSDWTQAETTTTDTSYTLEGLGESAGVLADDAEYFFQVYPINAVGEGEPTVSPRVKLPICYQTVNSTDENGDVILDDEGNAVTEQVVPDTVCSGLGQCVVTGRTNSELRSGVGTCSCDTGSNGFELYLGDLCEIQCPGAIERGPCNGLGMCSLAADGESAECSCEDGGVGPSCLACPAYVAATDTEPLSVCSDFGVCTFDLVTEIPACTCFDNHNGTDCSYECPGFPDNICGQNGQCVTSVNGTAVCECTVGFGGDLCDIECENRCNLNGVCVETSEGSGVGVCECYEGFKGTLCDAVCPGTLETGLECSGHGTCSDDGRSCTCENSHVSDDCSAECPGYVVEEDAPCAGVSHGSCSYNNETLVAECTCTEEYKGYNCAEAKFKAAQFYEKIDILFGVSGYDGSEKDPNDIEDNGIAVYALDFDLETAEAQQYVYDVCVEAQTKPDFLLRGELNCPMFLFETYLISVGKSFPSDDFHRDFLDCVTANQCWADYVGYSGTRSDGFPRMSWLRLRLQSQVLTDQSGTQLETPYGEWEAWIDDIQLNAPVGVPRPLQSSELWVRMAVELEFVRGTVTAMAISVASAFVAIVLFTRSFRSSVFATVTILGIVVCVIAYIVFQGWSLGVIEAIAITILVGFSVDYSLHVAHAFNESHAVERENRARDAVLEMGSSVFSAAVTTVGATFVLFFTQIQFFVAFGQVVCATSFLSIFWTLGFFVACLSAFGPRKKKNWTDKIWCIRIYKASKNK